MKIFQTAAIIIGLGLTSISTANAQYDSDYQKVQSQTPSSSYNAADRATLTQIQENSANQVIAPVITQSDLFLGLTDCAYKNAPNGLIDHYVNSHTVRIRMSESNPCWNFYNAFSSLYGPDNALRIVKATISDIMVQCSPLSTSPNTLCGKGVFPQPQQPRKINFQSTRDTWVLLGLDWNMGAITIRNPNMVAGVDPKLHEGYRTFPSYTSCKAAMKQVIAKFNDQPHSNGGDGQYICTNLKSWSM